MLENGVTGRAAIFQEHYLLPSTRDGAIWPLKAALAPGFDSYSQLHRVFWQVEGMNPKAYLRAETRNVRANQVSL